MIERSETGEPLPVVESDVVTSQAEDVTRLLRAWRQGDRAAFDEIVPVIYDELRRLAAFIFAAERPGHTFGPTELISEAYLRLVGSAQLDFNDRAHFFAIASRNMRQIPHCSDEDNSTHDSRVGASRAPAAGTPRLRERRRSRRALQQSTRTDGERTGGERAASRTHCISQ